ncbi:hypothetical protein Q1695_007259 [Nippostrongylus brasiliensis]|nr:hypothetical protein Q1695_007259 [Nippostrongylus brasiliensis]
MFKYDAVSQEHINRKTLIDWVRISGLEIPKKKMNYDEILQSFATNVIQYPSERPSPFSWPTQAGRTRSGIALRARVTYDFWRLYVRQELREQYEKAGETTHVSIVKGGLIKIGNDEPIRAPIAALKLKVDMTKWNGSDVVELLTINERKALGLEAAVSESVKAKDSDSANGVPIPFHSSASSRKIADNGADIDGGEVVVVAPPTLLVARLT